MRYIIKVVRGRDAGKTQAVESDGPPVTVGRKPANTLALTDIKISGNHGTFIVEQGRLVFRDLGSTNGTFFKGEKIESRALEHGDTLVMGGTEIVIHEEGRALITLEPPPPTEEKTDVDEEVRVIHDVRGVRRGFGGLVLLAVLILGAGGAGAYYFLRLTPEKAFVTLEARNGNLLAEGWSFEEDPKTPDLSALWDLKAGSETFFVHQRKEPCSGLYSINASMPEGGIARGVYARRIQVNPRRQYTASAMVKITGGALAALKAVFYEKTAAGRQPLYTDVFASGREIGSEFQRIEGTVFPPPEADDMEFVIIAAGRGRVVVDDVELMEEPSTTPTQLGSSGVMDFFSCGSGFLVRRIGRTLFLGGRIIAVHAAEGQEERLYTTDEGGFNPDGEGYLYCGPAIGLIRINRNLQINAAKVEGTFTLPALAEASLTEVRYAFDLLADYAEGGVGVLSEGTYTLLGSPFPSRPVDALIFGSAHDRVMISFERPLPVKGVERRGGGATLEVSFKPGEEIRFVFGIKSDFTEEARAAQVLVQEAARAEEQDRYGEALKILGDVLRNYPYNESVIDRAEKLQASILTGKQELLSKILERLKSARFLGTPEEFLSLEGSCREALVQYPEDKDFLEALERIREQGSALLEERRANEAERFFQLARNLYVAKDRKATLAEVQHYMETRFPGSDWTEMALSLGGETKSPLLNSKDEEAQEAAPDDRSWQE